VEVQFKSLNLHAGINEEIIMTFMDDALKMAKNGEIWIFFDESEILYVQVAREERCVSDRSYLKVGCASTRCNIIVLCSAFISKKIG